MIQYEDTYKIKPLEWHTCIYGDCVILALSILGIFTIQYVDDNLYWSYIFQENVNEDRFPCDSLEEGKREANEYYKKIIERALIKL
jgi:hypothetical protein